MSIHTRKEAQYVHSVHTEKSHTQNTLCNTVIIKWDFYQLNENRMVFFENIDKFSARLSYKYDVFGVCPG